MEVKLQFRKAIGMYVLIKRGGKGDLAASTDKGRLEQVANNAGWRIVEKWS